MSKKNNESILKSKFFLKLFGIPSICWILLELWIMDVPNDDGKLTTWPEFFQETFSIIIIWFIISFIVALIANKFRKNKLKTRIVKETQYITKQDDKIIAKPKDIKEEANQKEVKKTKKKIESKCIYTCESKIDSYEYKKMAKYFPKRMYWVFVIRGLFLNIIFTALIAIISKNWLTTLVFFIVYQIYLLIYYKVRLEPLSEKVFNNRKKHGKIETNLETEFYEDYFIRKGKKSSLTIDYSEISRCVENDTNFYLEYPLRNVIIILQKNRCDLELISFLRDKFKNLENHLGDSSSYRGVKKTKNSNLVNIFMIILFISTLGCLGLAMYLILLINEINPQHGFNFIKTTRVFWYWLPVPLLSIILGVKFNKDGFKCTKNIVAGVIMAFLLFVYGSFSLFPTFSTDYDKINDYKKYIDANLPNNGELEIEEWETYFDEDKTNYTIINAYYDKEDVNDLVSSIENSSNWILSKEIKSKLKILIPSQFKSDDDIYYSIYNKTTNQYNTLPETAGNYEVYAMKYDKSDKHLEINKFNYSYK